MDKNVFNKIRNIKNKKIMVPLLVIALIYYFVTGGSFENINNNNQQADNTKQTEQSVQEKTDRNELDGKIELDEDKFYYSMEDVALYLYTYGKLPQNYLTKDEARELGWDASEGNLWDVTNKGVIGGDRFGNREGLLPDGVLYYEADVNYSGGFRGDDRLVYTEEGKVIYFTGNHYESFEVIYE